MKTINFLDIKNEKIIQFKYNSNLYDISINFEMIIQFEGFNIKLERYAEIDEFKNITHYLYDMLKKKSKNAYFSPIDNSFTIYFERINDQKLIKTKVDLLTFDNYEVVMTFNFYLNENYLSELIYQFENFIENNDNKSNHN